MYIWFFVCLSGATGVIPLHFLSVEHLKLQEKYGKETGTKIGKILGLISGWGFFFFWVGLWISPQPGFSILVLQSSALSIPFVNSSIPLSHLIVSAAFLAPGTLLAVRGVRETTLKVAETHRAERIVTSGVYSRVRHPQYLGGLMAHIGISFLMSALYSLISTPLMVILIYLMSKKEERELVREFGKEYEDYKKKVPMFIPKKVNA